VKVEWRGYADMEALCRAHIERVRALRPDVIVGIPRSGMLPASLLALALGLPLVDLHSFVAGRMWAISDDREASPLRARRVLIVDDASAYGIAMPRAVRMVTAAQPAAKVMTCAVFATPNSVPRFDIAMEAVAKPRIFEWNWWRSGKLAYCCLDIDGVICRDPTGQQRRDPALYSDFVANAAPLWVPLKRVGALVTGRDRAHRSGTEDWMRRHGVSYGALHMHDGPSPRNAEKHARSKADFYAASPASLFIESSDKQAALIAQFAGKPVVAIETRRLYA
jgi:hypoxanthine phosphoribosyltransferase